MLSMERPSFFCFIFLFIHFISVIFFYFRNAQSSIREVAECILTYQGV